MLSGPYTLVNFISSLQFAILLKLLTSYKGNLQR